MFMAFYIATPNMKTSYLLRLCLFYIHFAPSRSNAIYYNVLMNNIEMLNWVQL